jgi:hypothetical protein
MSITLFQLNIFVYVIKDLYLNPENKEIHLVIILLY